MTLQHWVLSYDLTRKGPTLVRADVMFLSLFLISLLFLRVTILFFLLSQKPQLVVSSPFYFRRTHTLTLNRAPALLDGLDVSILKRAEVPHLIYSNTFLKQYV